MKLGKLKFSTKQRASFFFVSLRLKNNIILYIKFFFLEKETTYSSLFKSIGCFSKFRGDVHTKDYRTVKPSRDGTCSTCRKEGHTLHSVRSSWRRAYVYISSLKQTYKKSGKIAPHVEGAMYVTESQKQSTRLKKVVDYNKSMNQHHRHHESGGERGGGGGGGGTHIAATVKNTVRRLLRRTKSHRDPPSTNQASTMTAVVANGHVVVPPPPTRIPTATRNEDVCLRRPRYSRRPQVRKRERSLLNKNPSCKLPVRYRNNRDESRHFGRDFIIVFTKISIYLYEYNLGSPIA